jgi:hypothetical protein
MKAGLESRGAAMARINTATVQHLHCKDDGTTSSANWLISKPAVNGRFAMPWTANDAQTHTHKATTSELKELWAKVANERLEKTGNEGRAIREANAVVARQAERS